MQFFVSISVDPDKPQVPPPQDLAEAESEVVRSLYMSGLIRQIWVRADKAGALLVVEADTAEAAAQELGKLPLVRAGILRTPEIVALAPYWGFGPRG